MVIYIIIYTSFARPVMSKRLQWKNGNQVHTSEEIRSLFSDLDHNRVFNHVIPSSEEKKHP